MADASARIARHLARAAEELARAFGAALSSFDAQTQARASLYDALRSEERRWRARSAGDSAAARVADVFGALADVLEPARDEAETPRTRRFDPPRGQWDTPARWRS
jgi:hypothetical protein